MSDVLVKVANVCVKFCKSLKGSLWYGGKDAVGEIFGGPGLDPILTGRETTTKRSWKSGKRSWITYRAWNINLREFYFVDVKILSFFS